MAIIVGGILTGVEMWNPATGLVSLLMDVHPVEQPGLGLTVGQMIPINGILFFLDNKPSNDRAAFLLITSRDTQLCPVDFANSKPPVEFRPFVEFGPTAEPQPAAEP